MLFNIYVAFKAKKMSRIPISQMVHVKWLYGEHYLVMLATLAVIYQDKLSEEQNLPSINTASIQHTWCNHKPNIH